MAKVLVTGAGGYIGIIMCQMLIKQKFEVIALDRFFFGTDLIPPALKRSTKYTLLKKDIRSVSLDDFKGVEIVIDLAGLSNDPSCDLDMNLTKMVNIEGGVTVAKLAKQAGVSKLIYSSSCSVYGTGKEEKLNEDSDLVPVSAYAKAKVHVESQILKMADDNFSVTILRNATVYGLSPRMRFDLVINVMTLHAFRNHRIFIMGGGRQWRPIIHIEDVCRAFLAVISAAPDRTNKQIFNIGSNGQNFRVEQIANVVKGVLPETEIIIVPDDADKRSYNVSFDKANEVLSFEVTKAPVDGIIEIKDALAQGHLDPSDPRTITIKYYEYLLNAEKVVREVAVDGKIF